jgi:hypothetical protein
LPAGRLLSGFAAAQNRPILQIHCLILRGQVRSRLDRDSLRRTGVESELSFVTNEELIAELMRRQTFLGVVVHSEADWKHDCWGDERNFRVHFNGNLATEEASRLLNRVAHYIDCHHC